jgi:NAD(P)-dependent dehydrogenase (short-subunit alcohol dehydrogenase family)
MRLEVWIACGHRILLPEEIWLMTDAARKIVITGVSRGLGRSLLQPLISAGHVVAGCARRAEVIEQLRSSFGSPHCFDAVDVAQESEVRAWAESVLTSLGPPDLLINNAALINANAPLWKVPSDEFSKVIDVNIKGVFHVIKAFLPTMLKRQHGIVVNLSSGWGRSASADVAPYCATKWAVEGLTQSLAQELPSGMAAIPVNPGIIDTEMLQSCFGSNSSAYPNADQWATRAVPFLLSLSAKDNGRPLTV